MKLNAEQKRFITDIIKGKIDKGIFFVRFDRVTFAVRRETQNSAKIGWSIHSVSDGKFRPKTGAYVALTRCNMPIENIGNDPDYALDNLMLRLRDTAEMLQR